jgi:uncharacterized delta-60 repeat protein
MGSGSNRVDGGGNGSATRSDSLEVYASSQADADAVQVTSLEPGALGADAAAFAAGYTIKVVNGSETDYLKNIQQVNVWRWTDANGDHVRDAGEVAFVRGVQTVLRVNETQVSSTDPAIDTNGNLLANAYSLAFAFGTPLNDVFVAGTSISATGRALMDQYKRGAYVDMGGGNDAVVGSAYGDIINGGKGVNRVDGGANDGTDPNGYVARDSLQVNLTNQAGGAGAVSAVRLTSAMTGADGQAFADGYAWKVTAPGETDYVKNIEQVNVFTWDDANGNGVFDNGEATGGKTIQLAPQINEVAVSSTDPAKDANGQPLVNSYHFAWAYGTDGDDVISAASAVSARTLGLMDQYKRGMYFDTGAGNDVLAGTGYGDEFHAGAGTNKIDGGANAGTDANGFAMRDVLQVQVSPQSPAVNVIKLTASMGGADATAFGEGYTWKVSAAGETDYIKNIETVRVLTWNDANGNGQMDNGETAVREILLAPHTDEVRVSATDPAKDVDGNALSTYQNFAWAYGGIGDDVIGPADATAQAQALMTQYQRGMFFDTGAGNDTLAGTAWGDDFVAGPGINRVDGGANGGTDFAGQPAHDVLEVYVADQAAADAVTVTALTAAMAGDDGAAYAAGYRFKVANGSVEVDYLKDIEQVNVAIWNDKNGDGQRYYSQDSATNEVTFVRTITPGAEPPPPPPPPSGNSAPTFGPQAGVSVVDGGFDFAPIGFTTLGNGKYLSLALMNQVADGNNYASVLVRHNADGSLDTSFGSGGRAFPGVTFGNVTAPVVQADGKILWAVSSDLGPNADFKIVRLNGDGSVDTSFGTNGAALVSLSAGVDTPSKLLIQGDGKIVVAGTSATNSPGSDFAAVRLNADGSLDTGYNGGGKVTVSLSGGIDKANAAALQADGKLVIAGRATGAANNDYAVVRINTDGSVDTTFAGTGKLVLPVGAGTDVITSIAVLGDGGILLGGNSAATGGNDLALVKLKADGTLDTGFGTGGKLVVQQDGINDQLNQVKVQADGKIVVAASHGLSVEVLRLNADGTADTGFGHDGKVMMSLRGIFDRAVDLAFAGDKIVLLAGAGYTIDDAEGLVLARLNADGSLDTSFAPSQVGSLGGTVHADGIHPAVLDMNAAIYDAELAARNDYNGATLTLVRHGGASAEDLFVATGEVSFAGGVLSVAGAAIGHIDNSGGTLTLHFDAGSSQGLVNRALHGIGYANSNATPPSGVTIDWSFSDGNDGTQGSGGAMAASGSTSVQIGVVTHEVVRAYANPATAADGRMLASIESFASVSGTLAADNVDATGFSPAAQALMAQYQRGASFNTAGGGDHVTGTAYADSFSLGKGVNYVDGGANVKAPDMLFLSAATQAAADAVQVVQLTSGMAGLDATAFAQGYTWKVVAGDETDYVKNVEMVGIGVFDGTGQMTYHRDVALAVTVTESGPTGGDIHHVANVQGTDRADTIDMSGDTPLLSADAKAAMDSNGLGVYIDGGAGDDTIIGTAHPDMFANGPGNSHIDGGANSGPEGQDVFQVAVGTAEQVAAVAVVPSDDPAYTWMVTYGAGSTQKDYLKNVEGVNVFVPNSGTGRWIPLALTVQENNSADLSKQYHMAFVNGTSLGEHFDAGTDLSAHTHTVMDQYQRGVWIDMGGGDDTVTGSQYYDDIRPGAGTNYVDGGANAGSTPDGHQQGDTLHVSVASQADADAAQVTKLAAGMSGADAGAFAQGYTFKVTAAGETDYIRNIEGISVEVTDANGQVSSSRHIALALSVNQGDLSAGGVGAAAFINGTLDADVIDASAASPLLPDAVKAAMDSQGRGVYIDGGAGNDTITGSAHPDTFINGSGNSHIDGGANVGAEGQDVFQVAVTSAAQVDAVTVLPSDDPNYTWMVTYGAGSTEKDYLKNVEGVSVYVPNGTTGRWIPLALSVHENGSADLGTQYHMAFVDGTVTDERFDAGTDLSAHAHSVMDQYQRGLYVEMGGGDDTVVGSAYYDDINAGAGINYVDGGGNAGAAPDGHHPGNSLHVSVDSQATADAVQVTQLAAGMSGADADAFAQGYKYKVVAPGETDYVKNIDHVWVEYATGTREIGLSVSVFEFDRTAPDAANYFDLANINGTIGNDVIDASAGSSLLSSALQDAMASSKRGVYINGGAGDDTITGSAYADTFENGAGNSRIDGGANATNMPGAIDTFSIKVATAAELAAVQVAVSDDPNYQFMVTYGAGSTQKDYLKNIEGVNAYVDGSSDGGRFIQLAVSVNEVSAADAATSTSMAWANGSAFNDTFDAGVNVTAATQSLMTQYSRGVWVNMGAGDDTVIGSAFGDDITAGAGVNHIDGGANGGTDSGGQPAQDILRVMVASEAAAAAVTAVALDNTATGADLLAFNAGYTYKITAGDEIDYVKKVEQYTVSVWNDANHDGRVDYGTEVTYVASHNIGGSPAGVILVGVPVA